MSCSTFATHLARGTSSLKPAQLSQNKEVSSSQPGTNQRRYLSMRAKFLVKTYFRSNRVQMQSISRAILRRECSNRCWNFIRWRDQFTLINQWQTILSRSRNQCHIICQVMYRGRVKRLFTELLMSIILKMIFKANKEENQRYVS